MARRTHRIQKKGYRLKLAKRKGTWCEAQGVAGASAGYLFSVELHEEMLNSPSNDVWQYGGALPTRAAHLGLCV